MVMSVFEFVSGAHRFSMFTVFSKILNIFCHPPFRQKAEGHSFRLSVLEVCTLCTLLLLQFYSDSFETLQMS